MSPTVGSRLFGNRYQSGILWHVRALVIGEFPRHYNPGDIVGTESKTLGNPPFSLHVEIVGVIFGKANGEELELAKDEELQIILDGGKPPHQAVAVRRIRRRKSEEELWWTIV